MNRRIVVTMLIRLALLVLIPATALAQASEDSGSDDTLALRTALGELGYRSTIRVAMADDRVLEGRYSGHDRHELSVTTEEGRPHRVLLDEVVTVFERRGMFTTGLARGGVIGTVVGGFVLGGLIAIFCSSEGSACPAAVPISGGIVGAGGALVGGGVGLLSHRWQPVYNPHPKPVAESSFPVRRAGTLWLRAGVGVLHVPDVGLERGGPGFEAAVEILGRGRFSLAGELGYYDFVHAGSLSRVGLQSQFWMLRDRWRPYAIGGAGLYVEDDPLLGFNAGAGLAYALPSQFHLNAEFRFHGRITGPEEFNMFSLTVGAGYAW